MKSEKIGLITFEESEVDQIEGIGEADVKEVILYYDHQLIKVFQRLIEEHFNLKVDLQVSEFEAAYQWSTNKYIHVKRIAVVFATYMLFCLSMHDWISYNSSSDSAQYIHDFISVHRNTPQQLFKLAL